MKDVMKSKRKSSQVEHMFDNLARWQLYPNPAVTGLHLARQTRM